jgi:hypothetical protein
MSSVEKVKQFNEVLETLLLQFAPIIGTTYHRYFKMYAKANAVDPIKYFWIYANPLEEKILSRDETYFTNADNHKESSDGYEGSFEEIMRLTGIYEKLDDQSRDALWDFTQALFVLAKEYNTIKSNK